jgi:hypothetical protein
MASNQEVVGRPLACEERTGTGSGRDSLLGLGAASVRSSEMAIHVALLLAVPAVAGGFLQAFHQFAFLLWPFNLARHLPRACIALRSLASFYDAELRRYVNGVQPPPPTLSSQYASLGSVRQWTPDQEVVMIALVNISYF